MKLKMMAVISVDSQVIWTMKKQLISKLVQLTKGKSASGMQDFVTQSIETSISVVPS